jgi:hypothetical protein
MTWDSSRDLLGWDLDDVLEGYDVDFEVEPRNVLLDPDVRDKLDHAHPSLIDALTDRDLLDAGWTAQQDRFANRVYGEK